jgi:hypothetical protein
MERHERLDTRTMNAETPVAGRLAAPASVSYHPALFLRAHTSETTGKA